MMKTILLIFVAIQLASSRTLLPDSEITTASSCKTNDDCAKGSCCVNTNLLIMSKRRQLSLTSLLNNGSTCKQYTKKGDECTASFNTCGCEPGSTCQKVADLQAASSKAMIFRPPGIYQCV